MQPIPINLRPAKPEVAVSFVKFSCNLVSYGIRNVLGEMWRSPYHETDGIAFDEKVGAAALVFRHRHSDEFSENIADFPVYILESAETVVEYFMQFLQKTFKGRVPLMELIVYCAFLVDLAVCCCEEDKREYITDILEESYDVFEDYIKPYFHVIGGWHAINQMAVQYLDFVKAMTTYSALMSGAGAADSPMSVNPHADYSLLADSAHRKDSAEGNDPNDDSKMDVGPNDGKYATGDSSHRNGDFFSVVKLRSSSNLRSHSNATVARNDSRAAACGVGDDSQMDVSVQDGNDSYMSASAVLNDYLYAATRNCGNSLLDDAKNNHPQL